MTDKKIKVLTLSDHPMSPSGVGNQTRYMCDALLSTGRYQIISLGGAVKHQDYKPVKVNPEKYGDNWVVFPVDNYGTPETIRSILRTEKPDIVWFMTDPRFWEWLWLMDNEIRQHVPLVYYHVWDNHPAPVFNKGFYKSNDLIVSISKLTRDIVDEVVEGEVENIYHPHGVNNEVFKPLEDEQIKDMRKKHGLEDKFVFFWNNRNARRKLSGSIVYWFNKFCHKIGRDKAVLIMHTDPMDPYGQDLDHLINHFGANEGQILISREKVDEQRLSAMYNMADCTINVSDAEGFGLATLESLSCGTPIIVNMTGGLQEQVTDGENWFGIGIEPSSKALIGSQQVPYIFEDRISEEDFINSLTTMYETKKEERKNMGSMGREHVLKNYSFEKYRTKWVEIMDNVCESCGSWENRKGYMPWELIEI